uniref:Parathyroid hormone n=1 Tax=Salarias fasciatus TaxID=181472 RepID=A0A672HKE1_SALFA
GIMERRALLPLLLWLCVVLLSVHVHVHGAGRPLRKRTVSEVQLMHDLGEHRRAQERREWLQTRIRGLRTAAGAGAGARDERRKVYFYKGFLSEMMKINLFWTLVFLSCTLNIIVF